MTYIPASGGGGGSLPTSTIQPSTGSYTAGDLVLKNAPAADGSNMLLLGWSRLTTGSNHTTGVDWLPVYVSLASPVRTTWGAS